MKFKITLFFIALIMISIHIPAKSQQKNPDVIATFSIVAADPDTGEVGVAVASRFFAVGTVVPWAKANVGAVATQSFCNTSFGWRGLDLLEKGASPDEAMNILIRNDEGRDKRQVGIIDAKGNAATYTGSGCVTWAGGRKGPNYAVQGNILTGEDVVKAMESAFLKTRGTLAERMYAALVAGDSRGGDSRGKQSAALIVAKENAGYGGFTDRAIDIRVDDHKEPFKELGRLLRYAQMNYSWNVGWTLFTEKRYTEALPHLNKAVSLDPKNAELYYDLAVTTLATGNKKGALDALEKALSLNPKLKSQAVRDNDMKTLHSDPRFKKIIDRF